MSRPTKGGAYAVIALLLAVTTSAQLGTIIEYGSVMEACGKNDPLPVDMFDCATGSSLPIYDTHLYTVQVSRGSNFVFVVQLRSISGDADLVVSGPNGTEWSSQERIGEDVVTIPASALQASPGTYIIKVVGYQTYTTYTLNIQSLGDPKPLVASEVSLLAGIYSKCCNPEDYTMSSTCTRLQRATAANRTASEDLCSQPPNICDSDGHLTKLVLVGDATGNLVCNPDPGSNSVFPSEFGGFERLESLDLSYNTLIGSLGSVAGTISKLASLKRLYLMHNNFNGAFNCSIITPSLEVLYLSENILSGPLPSCALQSATLQQLSLSANMLTGPLPDLPTYSPLAYLDVGLNGAPDGPAINSTGLTGTIPASIKNAKGLLYLDVQSNSLSGTIPDLPTTLEVFVANNNQLKGSLPSSIGRSEELRTLRASNNKLTGRVPSSLASAGALISLQLSNNALTGAVNFYWVNPYLNEVDLSGNKLSGDLPYALAAIEPLRILNLAGNKLTGSLANFAARLSPGNALVALNLSGNAISGGVPQELQALRLFSYVASDTYTSGLDWDPLIPKVDAVFDMASNRINGSFPMWMVPALSALVNSSASATTLTVRLGSGGTNTLACPPPASSRSQIPAYLPSIEQRFNLSCDNTSSTTSPSSSSSSSAGTRAVVRLSAALGLTTASPPPSPASSSAAPGGGGGGSSQQQSGADGGTPASSGGKSSAVGAIAGGIAGACGGAVLLAGAAWWLRRQGGTRRAAYRNRRVPLTFNSAFDDGSSAGPPGAEYEVYDGHSDAGTSVGAGPRGSHQPTSPGGGPQAGGGGAAARGGSMQHSFASTSSMGRIALAPAAEHAMHSPRPPPTRMLGSSGGGARLSFGRPQAGAGGGGGGLYGGRYTGGAGANDEEGAVFRSNPMFTTAREHGLHDDI